MPFLLVSRFPTKGRRYPVLHLCALGRRYCSTDRWFRQYGQIEYTWGDSDICDCTDWTSLERDTFSAFQRPVSVAGMNQLKATSKWRQHNTYHNKIYHVLTFHEQLLLKFEIYIYINKICNEKLWHVHSK